MSRGYSEVRVDAEIAEWPGVEVVAREKTAKHQRVIVRFNGVERFVVYPLTPSDKRGELNHIQNVRQTLRDMGAVRNERRKASIRRTRNKPRREALAHIKAAPVKANPFEVLQAVQFRDVKEPMEQNASPLRLFLANIGSRVKKVLVMFR